MENVSATSLYVQACKFLLCGEDRSSWDQLMAILPQLRNALTCRVCRGLIVDPLSSGYCQHYVCKACLKKKRVLNPECKWCLDFSTLRQSDEQIRVVLACYKLLCEAIKSSSHYVNNEQNLTLDKLLKEAKLNTDISPNSCYAVSNINSDILDKKMADNIVSHDQLKPCARETKDAKPAVNRGGETINHNNLHVKEIEEAANSSSKHEAKEQLEPCIMPEKEKKQPQLNADEREIDNTQYKNDNVFNGPLTVLTNGQLQPDVTNMKPDEIDHINWNGTISPINLIQNNAQPDSINIDVYHNVDCKQLESNGNGESAEKDSDGAKAHPVRKGKSKNKRACLRPRNGQLVQKFEAGRKMRKRKLVTQSHNKNNRPRKRVKIGSTK